MKSRKGQGVLFDIPPPDQNHYEKRLFAKGYQLIAGVDEVGRGCLAGPVLAAAVILPFPCKIAGIKDSKQLTPKKREILAEIIMKEAVAFSYGIVDSGEIDRINILQATLKAMKISLEGLSVKPDYVVVDGSHVVPVKLPQLVIPKADNRSISVGAASILAKVKRDALIASFEEQYPGFKFSVHKGYGTKLHLEELRKHGPTPIHRRSFKVSL